MTIEWKGFRQEEFLPLQLSSKKDFEVIDNRHKKVDVSEIISFSKMPGVAVFREGNLIQNIPAGVNRTNAARSSELVITSTPPDWDILAGLISTALPDKVLVYDLDPLEGSIQTAVTILAGLVKFAIRERMVSPTSQSWQFNARKQKCLSAWVWISFLRGGTSRQ